MWCTVLIVVTLLIPVASNILLKDNFENIEETWAVDVNGHSGHVTKALDPSGNLEYISTNVTNCRESSTPCYRAELKVAQSYRSLFFPSNNVELWFGFSTRIPSNWRWEGTSYDITSYIMQVHGGDNLGRSPIIGIRNKGTVMDVSICGNTAFSSPSGVACRYYNIGPVVTGVWENWVIHDVFSCEAANPGLVEVWRSGRLVLNVSGIINSYNDKSPHYLKIGTYVLQWKSQALAYQYPSRLLQWVGVDYQYIVVADANSTFQDVYSLAGTSMPTSTPTTLSGRKSYGFWRDELYGVRCYLLYGGIIIIGVLACAMLGYLCHPLQSKETQCSDDVQSNTMELHIEPHDIALGRICMGQDSTERSTEARIHMPCLLQI